MKRLLALLSLLGVLTTACGSGDEATRTTEADIVPTTVAGSAPETTSSTVAPPPTTVTTPDPGNGLEWRGELRVPQVLADFDVRPTWLDGDELTVGVADTTPLRQQGLMHITDLGDLDGMLFIFEQDTAGGFWMKNTLIPLDIAFFDQRGGFVDGFRMEPCVTDECPSYVPRGPFRYALEMAAGSMPEEPLILSLEAPE